MELEKELARLKRYKKGKNDGTFSDKKSSENMSRPSNSMMNIMTNFRSKELSPKKAQQIKLQQQCLFYTQRYEKLEIKNADAIK